MITVLLVKDLRRARRNPLPYLIHICVPLVITGLLGLVFAGATRGEGTGLGRIRVALVDEDDSAATRLVRGAVQQADAAKYVEPVFLSRAEAMAEVTNNRVSAMVVFPRGLASDFLGGTNVIRLELVKNPAQQFHPAVVEELLGVVVTGLNGLRRNIAPDLAAWREALSRAPAGTADYRRLADLSVATAERVEGLWRRLDPVPVVYEKVGTLREAGGEGSGGGRGAGGAGGVGLNVFALVLPGMAAMFLFFVAEAAMRDLGVEMRQGTHRRYATYPSGTFAFVLGKVLFAYAMVMFAAVVLLGLGPWLYGFGWRRPGVVLVLSMGLGLFAAGLAASLGAWLGNDRRAEVVTNLAGMILGLASGCAFPAESLPPLVRDHVAPWLPPYWFVQAVHGTQRSETGVVSYGMALGLMVTLGLGLTAFAAWRMGRGLDRNR